MPDLLIVLPTYDEVSNLESIVGRIRQAIPAADVLIVDDASPDGTGELADRLAAVDGGVSVLHRAAKDGLGSAYLAGFAAAVDRGYDFVAEIDADGSHDPAALPELLALARGADLVIGSRWVSGGVVRNWPFVRRAISRTGNVYARSLLGSKVDDLTSGFRVIRLSALEALGSAAVSSQGYCFQVEVAWRIERAGGRILETPIVFVERASGRSKMGVRIVAEALWRVTVWGVTERTSRRGRDGRRGT